MGSCASMASPTREHTIPLSPFCYSTHTFCTMIIAPYMLL